MNESTFDIRNGDALKRRVDFKESSNIGLWIQLHSTSNNFSTYLSCCYNAQLTIQFICLPNWLYTWTLSTIEVPEYVRAAHSLVLSSERLKRLTFLNPNNQRVRCWLVEKFVSNRLHHDNDQRQASNNNKLRHGTNLRAGYDVKLIFFSLLISNYKFSERAQPKTYLKK